MPQLPFAVLQLQRPYNAYQQKNTANSNRDIGEAHRKALINHYAQHSTQSCRR